MANTYSCVKMLEKKKQYLAMIFVQFAYAGMALFSKSAIAKGMNPYIFVAYRQAFATISLVPFAYFLDRKRAEPLSCGLLRKIFLVSLFGTTLSLNLYTYAMNYVSATFASASNNNIPALTFMVAVIFRIERFSIREFAGVLKLVGSVVSVCGAMVFAFVKGPQVKWGSALQRTINDTTTHNNNSNNNQDKWIQGCLLMLSANISWASWLVMQAPLVKHYPAKFRLTMVQCLFSCIQSTVWALSMERNISLWKPKWDLNLLSVAYCGVVVTGISYWLQLWAVENKGPLFTASFTPLALIITAIFSAFLWKEMLHVGSVCGGVLLILGLYSVLWGKNKEAKKEDIGESKEEANV